MEYRPTVGQPKFLTDMQGVWVGDFFVLTYPLWYRSGNGQLYLTDKKAYTNGASIPRLCWSFVGHPFDKRWRRPAAQHDDQYKTGRVPRHVADFLFYESSMTEGNRKGKAAHMWLMIRTFGKNRYHRKTTTNEDTEHTVTINGAEYVMYCG